MAGIGFELKKVFAKKGVLNAVKAYGYAAIICTGPMLFGILLLLGIIGLCILSDTDIHTRELLMSMITYTLLASTIVTALFSQTVTRCVSDMLFGEDNGSVLPTFWGSVVIMLVIGCVFYGAFLAFSVATVLQWILCYTLFGELIIVWNSMNFLSAIKDYKGLIRSFLASVAVSMLTGGLLLACGLPTLESLLLAINLGYGVMLVWNVVLLHRYFPYTKKNAFTFLKQKSSFSFLKWIDTFLPLTLSGFFLIVGMFAHLIIMWYSDIGAQNGGLFFSAPQYDVPALLAYLTALITTINFVISVEVKFYPKYRNHYGLYNSDGTIDNIKKAEKDMLDTLKTELFYAALKQLLFSILMIVFGGYLLDFLPLGFNEMMRGYFRTLCAAYGICAIGNMVTLVQFYFTDYKGALLSTSVFVATSVIFTVGSLLFPQVYYGFGFLLSSLIFTVVATIRLDYYTKRLPYYILAVQPIISVEKVGIFSKIGNFLNRKLEDRNHDE